MFQKEMKIKPGNIHSEKSRQSFIRYLSKNYSLEIVREALKELTNLDKRHVEGCGKEIYFHKDDPVFSMMDTLKIFIQHVSLSEFLVYAINQFPKFGEPSFTIDKDSEESILKGSNLTWAGILFKYQ